MKENQEICLALDTALEACSVGLAIRHWDGTATFGRSLALGRGHAEYLMGEMEALLCEAEISFSDLTNLAVTIGPGSFTGLRVGLATARALALALDIPLVGCSSLEALALTARDIGHRGPLAALIDARRNQIYGQLFTLPDPDQPIKALCKPAALPAEDFADQCSKETKLVMIGSGAAQVVACDEALDLIPVLAPQVPSMQSLAVWALEQPAPAIRPSPLYLRAPDAKPQMSKSIARVVS